MIVKKMLCCCLMLASVLTTRGEFFCRVRNFAEDNGLLQTHISNAVQDRSGFIWFATWNGLVRFDGQSFNTFKPILHSDGTISSNRIYNVKRSATTNGLWCVSSENRLYYFDKQTNQFTDVLSLADVVKDKRVKVLTPLLKGVTWVTFKDYSCLRLTDSTYQHTYRYYPSGCNELMKAQKIVGIYQDGHNQEWVLTDRGAVNLTRSRFVKGDFQFFKFTRSQVYLISKEGGITIVTLDGKIVQTVQIPYRDVLVEHAIPVGETILMLATTQGVWSYDIHHNSFSQHSSQPTGYLYQDTHQRIWMFGHDHRVEMLDLTTNSIRQLDTMPAFQGDIKDGLPVVLENATGTIVLKPVKGVLSYYDETAQKLKACAFYQGNLPVTYHPMDIGKYFIDHQQNLWLIQTQAADCISFHPTYFSFWDNPTRKETRAVFYDSNGKLWASDRSLSLYQKDGNTVRYLTHDGQWQQRPIAFSQKTVYCIQEDRQHRMWIGTKEDGLYLLTPQQGGYLVEHFMNNETDSTSLRSNTIYTIMQTREGHILIGSYGQGLSVARQQTSGQWTFHQVHGISPDAKIRCMKEVSKGLLLIGTADGLLTADLRDLSSPHCYTNTYRQENWGLKGNDIMSIVTCGKRLFVCVFGSGISEILSQNLLSDSIHFRNHLLPSTATADQIKTAISDGNYIWLMSEQAVTRFSPQTTNFHIFDKSHFTSNITFAEGEPILDSNVITAGTSEGLLSFRTDIHTHAQQQPRIVFTGIQYQNDILVRPLNDLEQLEIQPDRRTFALYLSALDYDGQDEARFRYRLQGFDRNWNYITESQHTVNYSNLPPGDYTLLIQSTNSNGEWKGAKREIKVHVVPRFVETLWFKLLLFLLLMAIFVGMGYAIIYLSRMRRLLQRKYSLLMTVDEFSRDLRIEKEQHDREEDERLFMKKSIAFFEDNIGNSHFVIEDLARHLAMSRTAYYTKMKSITGLSPMDFVKQMRIKKALKLMEDTSLSVSEVAYCVGFSDPKYFSKCFKAEMGITPTQYMDNYSSSKSASNSSS